jgi:hypothetical protein
MNAPNFQEMDWGQINKFATVRTLKSDFTIVACYDNNAIFVARLM